MSDLYGLELDGDGYVLDGETREFETATETLKVMQPDGSHEQETL